ncbi:unnamed protein product [Ranitomeya imitator]|uniref:Alpha-macroglobulin-like TED domain-containing protein n=1 Tax=Ranitomeya imitator TaxID=111125 RepID=A0ABN9M6F1_9NEOB|nr:unnamed protein product [Ranitomeya imitator]
MCISQVLPCRVIGANMYQKKWVDVLGAEELWYPIDSGILDQAVEWLVQHQDTVTGKFSEPGRVIHYELQGGQSGPITLTAYIVTSLLEDELYKYMNTAPEPPTVRE